MRIALAALAALTACSASAEAGCRAEGSYPGNIGPKQTVERTLTLSPPRALIITVTDSGKDALIMRVFRPSGAVACNKRGPSSFNDCTPTIKSKGLYKVRITNPLKRSVSYAMQCGNSD